MEGIFRREYANYGIKMAVATEPAEVGGRLGSPLAMEETKLPTHPGWPLKEVPVGSEHGAGMGRHAEAWVKGGACGLEGRGIGFTAECQGSWARLCGGRRGVSDHKQKHGEHQECWVSWFWWWKHCMV